jgi:hypothetical protein
MPDHLGIVAGGVPIAVGEDAVVVLGNLAVPILRRREGCVRSALAAEEVLSVGVVLRVDEVAAFVFGEVAGPFLGDRCKVGGPLQWSNADVVTLGIMVNRALPGPGPAGRWNPYWRGRWVSA